MYIARAFWTNKVGKTYESIWLRESFRDKDGKVKNRNILNLKDWSEKAILLLQASLDIQKDPSSPVRGRPRGSKNKKNRSTPKEAFFVRPEEILIEQGPSVGAIFTVYSIAQKLGIITALGDDFYAKLALWQVCSRVLDQGSRLSAVRMAHLHAAASIINFERGFTENDLYENLHWLSQNQMRIEDKLFKLRTQKAKQKTELFLYDVTSSYLEGEKNELAEYGYNRDKKRGKTQIVVGLLCDTEGIPVSTEVFEGNTQDPKTVLSQIKKVQGRFGCEKITFVGDRGMLKSASLKDLKEAGFSYITGITRPQVEHLIKMEVLEYGLFDDQLCEVEYEGIRYVFRRNPVRAEEIAAIRSGKQQKVQELVEKKNAYLKEHSRAKVSKALQRIREKIKHLNITPWLTVSENMESTRTLKIELKEEVIEEMKHLDGCYVLKTDLNQEIADKELVNRRYKDLSQVEGAFRTCKTGMLELRPVYVRLEASTRGHVFVVMLAYMIVQELKRKWGKLDLTVEEGLKYLSTLTEERVLFPNGLHICRVPIPMDQNKELLEAAEIKLPPYLPDNKVDIRTHDRNRKSS
jgi:transposase